MTYTEQLTSDYAAIREKLYGPMKRQARIQMPEPEPEPEPEKISRRVRSAGHTGGVKYYWSFGKPVPTYGLRWRKVLNEVAEKHDVCPSEMLSEGKADPVARARFECWYRLRQETTFSFTQIGKFFKRDHSTVVHGVARWREISKDGING